MEIHLTVLKAKHTYGDTKCSLCTKFMHSVQRTHNH